MAVRPIRRRERALNVNREERFRVLYETHLARVARYVARRSPDADVQDVVAETFLSAWRRFDELPVDPLPWLFVAARNVLANRRRSSERRDALHEKLVAQSEPSSDPPPDLSFIDLRLLAAIKALPEAEREAFLLVAWDGLEPARAARAAGCNPATFRTRLHRARRQLRQEIAPEPPFAELTDVRSVLEES